MKKSLLAVAAIGAFASAAQAQSSVTVYGILDVGFQGASYKNPTTATPATAANGVQFSESAESTSRLGFKGTEDLGGGRQAIFTAEFQLQPTDTLLSGNGATGLQNRQTFVGLHQDGVGAATIGTQYTGIFNAGAVTDPGQYNNVAGDLIYAVSGINQANNQAVPSANIVTGSGGSNVGFTTRTANTLFLQSDSFAGFRVNAAYTLNDSNTNQVTGTATTGGMVNTNGWGLGADYTWNKLFVTAQYQSYKQQTTATGTVSTLGWVGNSAIAPSLTITPGQNTTVAIAQSGNAPLNTTDNEGYVGATYNFGILKAYAQYVTYKYSDNNNTTLYAKRSAEQIGVRSYITPTIEAWGSAGLGRANAYGASAPTQNFNGWQLGSNYWLSKRTNLYAIYGSVVANNASNPAGTSVSSLNVQQYALGVRHTF
ncbi:putative porin [Polynucleobacter sphagniphilus]|uniref:porin n=1 Tax=Polynucleobacter sphagniphilus TaxID=1743169 RepID=UPI0024759E2C|nr:porin [Polynucleobacter sphagniphilus]MDH6249144.1 putative porin [Polynucleobacter sphagniphilus]